MKKYIFFLLALASTKAFAQGVGSIVPKQSKPEAGTENVYVYHPPKGLLIPENAAALIVYSNNKGTKTKKIPLLKNGEQYEFSFTAPDSTKVFIAGIVNEKKQPIDNNSEMGYVVYLYNSEGTKYPGAQINAARLLNWDAGYYLKLSVPADKIAAMYEAEYKLSPEEKNNSYTEYLRILYKAKGYDIKPEMLNYAKQQLSGNKDEKKWKNALTVYEMLKMKDKQKSLEEKILKEWPNGELAKQKAWTKIFETENTEDKINLVNDYLAKYNGAADKNYLYQEIAASYGKDKNWEKYLIYADSVDDKRYRASLYNNTAWNLCGESVSAPGENLEFAKSISKKSVDIIEEQIANPDKLKPDYVDDIEDFKQSLKENYDAYIDTYALLLYKLNQPDSAYYYQNIAIQNSTNPESFERCAAYAEKAKGPEFTKQFIEEQLAKGNGTAAMQNQLQNIYKQLNLSDEEYNKVIEKATAVRTERMKEEIKEKMKSGTAKIFTLKNLEDKTVSLASLKGKVIVVDFWATWCGPCKASFPGMQKAVNKFKNDSNVVFLFVDTWENKELKEMQVNAQKFITENKYSFNVLLDDKDKTVSDYNVDGIPTKFLINPKGDIQFMSIGFGGNEDALVDEISLMIETAKNNRM